MRPKKPSKRTASINVRYFPIERRLVELYAKRSGLSMSSFVRLSSLRKEIKYRFTKEEVELYRMLVEYRNNFRRISSLIKLKESFLEELESVIKEIDRHLKKF